MPQHPTIILVHGAFHQPEHFHAVASHLRSAGYDVLTPRLPSMGLASDPGDALHLDAIAVRDVLSQTLVDRGQDAILVMHSYGGLPGSEGCGMYCEEAGRSPQSIPSGKVRRMVYLAAHGPVERGAVILPKGVQIPPLPIDENDMMTHATPFEHFYEGDCSREAAQPALDLLVPMAASAFTTPTKYEAWKDYGTPCTYIKCLHDRAVKSATSDKYVERMRAAGVDLNVETMECGHSPAHFVPKELADLIAAIAD